MYAPNGPLRFFALTISNLSLVILILIVAIAAIVEGYRIVKYLKTMEGMKDQSVVRKVSTLATSASIGLIVALIGLALGTVIRVGIPSGGYPLCQAVQILYRVLEMMVILIITIPLKDYQVDTDYSSSTAKYTYRSSAIGLHQSEELDLQ